MDENVNRRLERFLSSKGFNVMMSPEGISNSKLASLSKSEKRVLVTNDSDFADSVLFPKEKIFSVVCLRIPQNEPESLLKSFSRLLKEKEAPEDFEGKLIILKKEGFEAYPMLSTALL
jgi:predicted nuclease of predicted toxin-antitoxin system